MSDAIEMIIDPRATDLGDFEVRRVLPFRNKRTVGPFIFFDHMGPAHFPPGKGIDVRPHPHIGLATMTYLFEGEILHRDSLGVVQSIKPGAVNWMTAGKGIVHSERSSDESRASDETVHGIQAWVALPESDQGCDPSFRHYPSDQLPEFDFDNVHMKLVAGTAFGREADVDVLWPTVYLDIHAEAGAEIPLPDDHEERAIYVVEGALSIDDKALNETQMAVLTPGAMPAVIATEASRVMLCGGKPIDGPRLIWWNLVSSDQALIDKAKVDWKAGNFAMVPGDDEFIPLPED